MLEVVHRTLAEERQPSLDAAHPGTQSQVAEQHQVERNGRGQDRVTTQEVDLNLHGITHPSEDVDVVPRFLVVLSGRIVVDAHLVVNIAIQVGEFLRLEDVVDNRQLADLLRLEVFGLVEHLAVTVAQDVGREPAAHAQHTCLEHRRKHGLHQRLSALEVLSGNGHIHLFGEFPHGRRIHTQIGRAHHEGSPFGNGCIGIAHTRRNNFRIVLLHGLLQRLQ